MNAIKVTPQISQLADDTESGWRVSTFCAPSNNCLEVLNRPDGTVGLRHSQTKDLTIDLSPGEWQAFLRGVHAGEFGSISN